MASSSLRRARRDSESSTDSWSVVEQEDRLDDEDDFSLNSDSCDSDCDSDCELRREPIVEEPPTSDEEEDDDENSEFEAREDDEEDEEEEEEEEVEEEESGALQMVKDEEWDDYYDDLMDQRPPSPMALRLLCFSLLAMVFFPLADVVASYVLGPEKVTPVRIVFGDEYSQQSYSANFGFEEREEFEGYGGGRSLRLLREFLTGEKPVEELRWYRSTNRPVYIDDVEEEIEDFASYSNSTIVLPVKFFEPVANVCSSSAIAPVPPAPFTPRKKFEWQMPRHQPCYVFVNQSKWTCNPKGLYDKKPISYKTTQIKQKNHEICAMKASQSMRHTTKTKKASEQCDSRQFQKYVPRRKHIAYKTPVPCKALTYKPSAPKPARKPSTFEDWHSKRSHLRAKLRSRA